MKKDQEELNQQLPNYRTRSAAERTNLISNVVGSMGMNSNIQTIRERFPLGPFVAVFLFRAFFQLLVFAFPPWTGARGISSPQSCAAESPVDQDSDREIHAAAVAFARFLRTCVRRCLSGSPFCSCRMVARSSSQYRHAGSEQYGELEFRAASDGELIAFFERTTRI